MNPRTWCLLGEKTGDNNQLLAMAEKLGWPFETKLLRYNLGRAVPPRYLGATLATVERASRVQLSSPWPDVVLAIGRRSVPVARWIRKQSGERTKLVLVGHPRVEPSLFDLVITTRQYPVPERANVVTLPLAMSRLPKAVEATRDEAAWLASLPRPHLLLALGGPTKYWDLDEGAIGTAVAQLMHRADVAGGTLIAIGSRRTPAAVMALVRTRLAGTAHRLVESTTPRFALLLHDADELFVTADSVSMLSEAIQTGKPVGMVPISLSTKGNRAIGGDNRPRHGWGYGRRDLRRIWRQMEDDGLVGTIEAPRAGTAAIDSAAVGAAAVRGMLAADADV